MPCIRHQTQQTPRRRLRALRLGTGFEQMNPVMIGAWVPWMTLERLRTLGVLYRCFRTRREIAEASASAPQEGDLDQTSSQPQFAPLGPEEEATRLAGDEPFSWRLSLRYSQDLLREKFASLSFHEAGKGPNGEHGVIAARPEPCGDVILARKDISSSYHLAVVHDDALQHVTHVVRGVDLFDVTPVHILIQHLLTYPTPTYHHHPIITGPDGKRFAKRDRSLTLAALRADGVTPDEIRRRLGFRV